MSARRLMTRLRDLASELIVMRRDLDPASRNADDIDRAARHLDRAVLILARGRRGSALAADGEIERAIRRIHAVVLRLSADEFEHRLAI